MRHSSTELQHLLLGSGLMQDLVASSMMVARLLVVESGVKRIVVVIVVVKVVLGDVPEQRAVVVLFTSWNSGGQSVSSVAAVKASTN